MKHEDAPFQFFLSCIKQGEEEEEGGGVVGFQFFLSCITAQAVSYPVSQFALSILSELHPSLECLVIFATMLLSILSELHLVLHFSSSKISVK